MFSQKKSKVIMYIIPTLLLGVFIGWYSRSWLDLPGQLRPSLVRENSGEYNFINPLLLVTGIEESPDFATLKKNVDSYITDSIKKNSAISISAYFQDLNSGNWTGVNEDVVYGPSSMLKVAVMVGYLKEASTNPKLLSEKLKYTHKETNLQNYPPEHFLENDFYTVKELIESMIVNSDNDSLESLYTHNRKAYINVFKELDISPPLATTTIDFMSPRIYSRIFRTLYSSTYLPRIISEQALQLLSNTNFKKGLAAQLPKNITVAHKFGEHTAKDSVGKTLFVELHDCGIIYYPEKPYLLCIMTKGNEFVKLESVISDISLITYGYIKNSK